jgi:hypothetical protein
VVPVGTLAVIVPPGVPLVEVSRHTHDGMTDSA